MAKSKISLEVVNFRDEMQRIENEVFRLGNIDIAERMDYATDQLRRVTPVDTGRARRGWYNKKIRKHRQLIDGFIVNDVEYISELNKGTSKQAPKYFIEQVLVKIGILIP